MKKNRKVQKWIIAGCILLVGGVVAVGFMLQKPAQQQETEESKTYTEEEILPEEAFDKMEVGMSIEEVFEIAGIEPYKNYTSNSAVEGVLTTTSWHAAPGENVYTVIFIDGKLSEKNFMDVIQLKKDAEKNNK